VLTIVALSRDRRVGTIETSVEVPNTNIGGLPLAANCPPTTVAIRDAKKRMTVATFYP